ncbi:hypothetical protein DOTSEDRAFT_29740 [Dothistroma septosporum NZE10]|uniref:Uncharacterized protein n=1 Tax=Dothistroma septosporum (strain NZE10 / CBS 128990) TaxID=675120 RepID=M2WHS7_DOTSN|nr:hypothetical protein DOTSEDRAFT_29740 [Dothistroma septosporum NZE10]
MAEEIPAQRALSSRQRTDRPEDDAQKAFGPLQHAGEQQAKSQPHNELDLAASRASNPRLKIEQGGSRHGSSTLGLSHDLPVVAAYSTDGLNRNIGVDKWVAGQGDSSHVSNEPEDKSHRSVDLKSAGDRTHVGRPVQPLSDQCERRSPADRASIPGLLARSVASANNTTHSPAASIPAPYTPTQAYHLPQLLQVPPAKWTISDFQILHATYKRGQSPAEAAVHLHKFTLEDVQAMWFEKFTKKKERQRNRDQRHAHEIQGWDQPDPQRLGIKQEDEEPRQTFRQNIMGNLKKRTRGL